MAPKKTRNDILNYLNYINIFDILFSSYLLLNKIYEIMNKYYFFKYEFICLILNRFVEI